MKIINKDRIMVDIINNKEVDKDIRLTYASELLYNNEISIQKFKELLEELNCYDTNRVLAEQKSNQYWDEIIRLS